MLSEDAVEETVLLFFWLVCVTLALLRFGNSAHDLINVLSATRPGCFSALAAGYFLTHSFSV
jgi:hypothetical protein